MHKLDYLYQPIATEGLWSDGAQNCIYCVALFQTLLIPYPYPQICDITLCSSDFMANISSLASQAVWRYLAGAAVLQWTLQARQRQTSAAVWSAALKHSAPGSLSRQNWRAKQNPVPGPVPGWADTDTLVLGSTAALPSWPRHRVIF